VVNPGFFNGAGNASTRLAWIDNSAVAKGVFKPQENAVLLAFMLMLYEGSCERSGSCACRRMKASRHTCWTLCDVPSVEAMATMRSAEAPTAPAQPPSIHPAELFVGEVSEEHHGVLQGKVDIAFGKSATQQRAEAWDKLLSKATNGCYCGGGVRECTRNCVGMFGEPANGSRKKNLRSGDTARAIGWVALSTGDVQAYIHAVSSDY
jgi:hypothetical protein